MDVVVEVGGWEHECCGEAIERDQLVDFSCIPYPDPDGRLRLIESHHGGLDVAADVQVAGRVTDIQVRCAGGAIPAVLRVPSGRELCGLEDGDDGHLVDPWTGEPVTTTSREFLVSVRPAAS
ncbi:hypothetical protein GB931_16960 [Modestobacter sp. I12A-02628]|nr:hypothetical protein [Goekera deserti]